MWRSISIINPIDTAVYEQGGPSSRNASVAGRVPDSAGHAKSGLAKDLHGSHFKKEEPASDCSTV